MAAARVGHDDGRHYSNPQHAGGSHKSEAVKGAAAAESAALEWKSADASAPDAAARVVRLSRQLAALIESVSAHFNAQAAEDDEEAESESDPPDETLYEGVGGAAYALLHASRVIASMQQSHMPAEAREILSSLGRRLPAAALTLADRAASLHASSPHHLRVTFFMGTSGILATRILGALHSDAADSKRTHAAVDADIAALLAIKHADPSLPDEILYGRAGLLHSLLLVSSAITGVSSLARHLPALRSAQDALFDEIVSRGESFREKPAGCPLMWSWHGKRYLGAAHGVTGILTLLMQCEWRFKGEGSDAKRLRTLVQGTLDFCISIRLPSGNFPSSLPDSPGDSSSDKLVQWCHGAPGLVFACLAAYALWSQPSHLSAARASAEVVWERGLLKKGLGLCHGIAGNAYVFLRLYDATGDRTQLDRAFAFLHFGLAGPHRRQLAEQPDVPDSLANGRAGCACAVADCMRFLSEAAGARAAGASASSSSSDAAASASAAASAPSSKVPPAPFRSSFPGLDATLP